MNYAKRSIITQGVYYEISKKSIWWDSHWICQRVIRRGWRNADGAAAQKLRILTKGRASQRHLYYFPVIDCQHRFIRYARTRHDIVNAPLSARRCFGCYCRHLAAQAFFSQVDAMDLCRIYDLGRTEDDAAMNDFLIASLAGFFAATISSMGLGGGGVLIIYLTLFAGVPQMQAQGSNLLFFLPIAALSLIIYYRRGVLQLKKNLPFILYGLLGCLPGYLLASRINSEWLARGFGAGLVLLGIYVIDCFLLICRRKIEFLFSTKTTALGFRSAPALQARQQTAGRPTEMSNQS